MELAEILRALTRDRRALTVIPGTVRAVDANAATCDVQPDEEGAPLLLDVLLLPVAGTGLLVTPAAGASCLVLPVQGDINTCVLLTCSDAASVKLRGDDLGGLVKARTLRAELDKTNAVLSAVVQALTTWVVVPSDGGAALKLAVSTALTGKVVGNFSDLENPNVTHA